MKLQEGQLPWSKADCRRILGSPFPKMPDDLDNASDRTKPRRSPAAVLAYLVHLLWYHVMDFDNLMPTVLLMACVTVAFLVLRGAGSRPVRTAPTARIPHSVGARPAGDSSSDDRTLLASENELVHVRNTAYQRQHSPEPEDPCPSVLQLDGPPDAGDNLYDRYGEEFSDTERQEMHSTDGNAKARRRKKKRKSQQNREVSPDPQHSSAGQNNVTRTALAVLRPGRTDYAHAQTSTPSNTNAPPEGSERSSGPRSASATTTTPTVATPTAIPGAAARPVSSVCATTSSATPTNAGKDQGSASRPPPSSFSAANHENTTTPPSSQPPSRTTSAFSPSPGSFPAGDVWYCHHCHGGPWPYMAYECLLCRHYRCSDCDGTVVGMPMPTPTPGRTVKMGGGLRPSTAVSKGTKRR
ncbi:hypothetical protein GE09DRAFT_243265 [Coniochaeta sp. 2T2.1]|nr:hypothetical protein GE09DRAFT_243265 [Coniochaeta sp. 2T2.1]